MTCIVTQNFIFYLNFIQLSKICAFSPGMILDTRHRRPGCLGIDETSYVRIVTQHFIFHFNFVQISKVRAYSTKMILDTVIGDLGIDGTPLVVLLPIIIFQQSFIEI